MSQLQTAAFTQHSRSHLHKLAVAAYLSPDVPLTVLKHIDSEEDLDLLKGAVPQLQDWARCWQWLRSVSFRCTATSLAFYFIVFVARFNLDFDQDCSE